jgi:hypothetical protein
LRRNNRHGQEEGESLGASIIFIITLVDTVVVIIIDMERSSR